MTSDGIRAGRGCRRDTGKERRRWHPAGTRPCAAEANRQLAADKHDRRGTGRSRLTLGDHIGRAWLPRKQRQLRLYILSPALGHLPLRSLRVEQIETLHEPATDLRTA